MKTRAYSLDDNKTPWSGREGGRSRSRSSSTPRRDTNQVYGGMIVPDIEEGKGEECLGDSDWSWNNIKSRILQQHTKLRTRFIWSPRLEFPAWRWDRNFDWLSRTHFQKRGVILRNKHRRKILEKLEIDTDKTEIKFKPNKFKSAKYTILSFPILNLLEQFRRGANFYFLVSMVLTLLIDSPISPYTWMMSLVFVIVVTMIKQAYEDYLRHKEDARINRRPVHIIKKGKKAVVHSEQIMVGDILVLHEHETVPCDVVLLSSSHKNGQCFIETSNLDGETSLKTRFSPGITRDAKSVREISTLHGFIECENPNPKLETFLGNLTLWNCEQNSEPTVHVLSNDNVLLAGSVLKNTEEVYSCCVYSGIQTKISLNSKITSNKFSTTEKSLNRYLVFLVGVLVSEMVISTILAFSYNYELTRSPQLYLSSVAKILRFFGADKDTYLNMTNIRRPEYRESLTKLLGFEAIKNYPDTYYIQHPTAWYLDQVEDITFVLILEVLLLWMVLYNYIIPLSVYVSLEFIKVLSSLQYTWDTELYDVETNEPAQCHTSDINDELGLITHLLTDKTGTITKNEMVLKMILRGEETFLLDSDFPQDWDRFMMVLCLCHSVQVSDGNFIASSPDEKALLEKCQENRFVYTGEQLEGQVAVNVRGQLYSFAKLAELPFDSVRKCMTVIVRDAVGIIHVLTKGAECKMFKACTSGNIDKASEEIDCFANMGLRTLAVGYKTINEDQLNSFLESLAGASTSIVNRAKYVREVYEELEQGLELLGATGIEDKLQDDVPETVYALKKAGVRIWMLTGDKKETAINAGHSAGILRLDSKLIDLCDITDYRDIAPLMAQIAGEEVEEEKETSMIVDDKSITNIFKATESIKQFQAVSLKCSTVIACRLSPIQKSQIVRLVKEADSNYVTAAIGDGGNDISMLQEAHVGFGIIGKEGRAAAQASDFAFSKFKYLRRSILVHGQWFYVRSAFLVQYSFYKNIACFTGQVFYMLYSNYSAMTLFESTFLFCFNTLYTSVPVLIYSVTEQNYSSATLLRNPSLYSDIRYNKLMSKNAIFRWMCFAAWHSIVSFFLWYFLYQEFTYCEKGVFYLQSVVAQTSVIIVNLKVLLEANYWTAPLIISVLLSILSYFAFTLFYHAVGPMNNFLVDNSDIYMSYVTALSEPQVWLCTLLAVVLGLLPDLVYRVIKTKPGSGLNIHRGKLNQTAPEPCHKF